MIKLYGIKNCDTVKKAVKFLNASDISYDFVDFKKYELVEKDILKWKKSFGDWPVNKKGRTFKQIKDEFEQSNDDKKISLIISNTSSIKRPILEKSGKKTLFGFDESEYSKVIK